MAQALDTRSRGRKNGVARDALKARAADVMDDFVELRKDVSALADAATRAARDEVRHTGTRLTSLGNGLRERATTSADYAREQIRERPGAAIGISLGAGLLIGLLMSRR